MGSLDLSILLTIGVFLVFFSSPVSAFGAGNIINISSVEGSNYRHGDIEDTLLQLLISIAHNRKFDDLSVKRVYFVCSSMSRILETNLLMVSRLSGKLAP